MATVVEEARKSMNEVTNTTTPDTLKSATVDKKPAELYIRAHAIQPLHDPLQTSTRWLTVSPYLEDEHLLDLNSVDTPNRLLALALTELEAATPHYATVRYEDALDWDSLMSNLQSLAAREGYKWTRNEFYVVEFRSRLKQDIDVDRLFRLDKESHIEATASGGLLKYWYGVPDESRRNLATCLWRSKEDAINGGKGPWHKQARAAIPEMYEQIDVKGLRLVIEDDVRSWNFGPHV
ncbi:hypothetical protein H2200_001223 [Cladophialophora chaetospira]|uniref:Uncharacterized protein n=1 Tax=Cladophialophora chaetospira TaxID=386627 RepID=A0AA38XKG6_9EURO|nr:hypothetical protein H2200_001223 [Cladophialophora chaetospira]